MGRMGYDLISLYEIYRRSYNRLVRYECVERISLQNGESVMASELDGEFVYAP